MSELINGLAQLGITEVRISYNGSSDEGYIEDYEFSPGLDDSSQRDLRAEMEGKLEDWAYNLLETHFGGWEINEGSSGKITLDVLNRKATISHDENVITTSNETIVLEIS